MSIASIHNQLLAQEIHSDAPDGIAPDARHSTSVEQALDAVATATISRRGGIGDAVEAMRPIVARHILGAKGNPTHDANPAAYYDSLRLTEESLRRGILRGLGYLCMPALMLETMGALHAGAPLTRPKIRRQFHAKAGRGRLHSGLRGGLVNMVEHGLRTHAELTISQLFTGQTAQEDLHTTFGELSQGTRHYGATALDHLLGPAWRELDAKEIGTMAVTHLGDRPLSRSERLMLLKPFKPLNAFQSFGNALGTTAEFGAMAIEKMQFALDCANCPRPFLSPYLFANLDKLTFGARLPFWSAQDLSGKSNDTALEVFRAHPTRPHARYTISFGTAQYQSYYESALLMECQGMRAPQPHQQTRAAKQLTRQFTDAILEKTRINDGYSGSLQNDIPEIQRRHGRATSVFAATAYVLSVAERDAYTQQPLWTGRTAT